VAGHVGLELANVILKKPLKCWANSHGLRNILGPETFRVRAAADQVPEPVGEVAVSTLGDTWQLGRHRLLCGNALELRAIATKGPGKNETPKSGLRDQGPDRRFCSPNPDTETKAYPRNAAVPSGFEGLRRLAGRDRTGWGGRIRTFAFRILSEPCSLNFHMIGADLMAPHLLSSALLRDGLVR
jgi:hypothetical protein